MTVGIDRVLSAAQRLGASDIHLKVGLPPIFRIKGDLRTVRDVPAITEQALHAFADKLLSERQREEFERLREVDLAYNSPDNHRYRTNIFTQRGVMGMVLRLIPPEVPAFDSLGILKTSR